MVRRSVNSVNRYQKNRKSQIVQKTGVQPHTPAIWSGIKRRLEGQRLWMWSERMLNHTMAVVLASWCDGRAVTLTEARID